MNTLFAPGLFGTGPLASGLFASGLFASGLFASGRIIDFVLLLTAIEAVFIVWLHRRTGRGPAPGDFLGNLLSGVCLLVAVRLALTGAWWPWLALCLLGSLAAHLTDLRRRW